MKSKDFNLKWEKVEHSNIQWIYDWSPLPQHGQHFGQFSVTLPLRIAIVVLYLYPHFKRRIQLKPKLRLVYLQLRLNKFQEWMNFELSYLVPLIPCFVAISD